MRRPYLILAGLLVCLSCPSGARTQSLTDVARAEEARRKAVKKPAKVYTNDDLARPGEASPPPPSTAAAPPAKSADGAKADAAKADPKAAAAGASDPKKDE